MSFSMNVIKNRFKKSPKSNQVFILGSEGVGKSALLSIIGDKLSMKNKGNQNMAGVKVETIKIKGGEVHTYNFDKNTFLTMTKFIEQSTTSCIIFVIDSRKDYIIHDAQGNDIRINIKEIGKIVKPDCHILVLCNKQDITTEVVLSADEITKILDIARVFQNNPHRVIPCSLTSTTNSNISQIISYLDDNHLIKKHVQVVDDNDDNKDNNNNNSVVLNNDKKGSFKKHGTKNSKSFINLFKKKVSSKKQRTEVIMILGLDKCGKSRLLDSFGFIKGKKSKTSIAIFEAETIKYNNCEFHVWNYEERSWPMCKSFFTRTTLLIYVIDSTQSNKLVSDNKHIWTVEAYLKKILGIAAAATNTNTNANDNAIPIIVNPSQLNKSQSVFIPHKGKLKQHTSSFSNDNPFANPSNYNDNNGKKKKKKDEHLLKCPVLFYLNKSDLDQSVITKKDLEEEIQLSRLMKSKGIKHFVQECSAKTKNGIYDGLIWCYMNGLLKSIKEIVEYANQNDIKLPTFAAPSSGSTTFNAPAVSSGSALPALGGPTQITYAQSDK